MELDSPAAAQVLFDTAEEYTRYWDHHVARAVRVLVGGFLSCMALIVVATFAVVGKLDRLIDLVGMLVVK